MELDIKIIELLWEFADKELKFGCIIKTCSDKILTFNYWKKNIGTIRKNFVWQDVLIEPQWKYSWVYKKEDGWEYFYTFTENSKTEIIWQYYLWSILRWLVQFDWLDMDWPHNVTLDWVYDKLYISVSLDRYDEDNFYDDTKKHTIISISLDLSTPPMERSDKQKQELLDFMEKLWKQKN